MREPRFFANDLIEIDSKETHFHKVHIAFHITCFVVIFWALNLAVITLCDRLCSFTKAREKTLTGDVQKGQFFHNILLARTHHR